MFGLFKNPSKEELYEDFWHWFEKNNRFYYDLGIQDLKGFDSLENKLKAIHPDLWFEFTVPDEKGVKELTITANGMKKVFPVVFELISKAPTIQNWKFTALKPRLSPEKVSISFDNVTLDPTDIYFKIIGEMNNPLNIALYIRNFQETGTFKGAVFINLDFVLGEFDTATKLGQIEMYPLEDLSTEIHPLKELPGILDTLK